MNDTKPLPSAYEALQRLKAAQKVRREAREKWNTSFDKFLDDSQRPLNLCDLMFGLAVMGRVVDRALETYKEIEAGVRPEDRTFHYGDTFDAMEHWTLREIEELVHECCPHLGSVPCASRFNADVKPGIGVVKAGTSGCPRGVLRNYRKSPRSRESSSMRR